MTGQLVLTPDELANLVAGVLAYNGYEVSSIALYKDDRLVDFDKVVVPYQANSLSVRTKPEEPLAERVQALRTIISPYGTDKVSV